MVPNLLFETNDTGGVGVGGVTMTRSNTFAASGSWSLRLAPSPGSNDTAVALDGDAGALRAGLVAGKHLHRVRDREHPRGPLGTLDSRARAISGAHKTAADPGYTIVTSAAGPTTGSARVSLTFTLPVGTNDAFIRFYNGASNAATNYAVLGRDPPRADGDTRVVLRGHPVRRRWVAREAPEPSPGHVTRTRPLTATSSPSPTWTVRRSRALVLSAGRRPLDSQTLTNSTTHPQAGSRGMLITWAAGGTFPQAQSPITTVVGRTYTASAYVWVPAGHPAVALVVSTAGGGTASTVTGALQRISHTWVATATTTSLQVQPSTSPTAGQQCWSNGEVTRARHCGSGRRPRRPSRTGSTGTSTSGPWSGPPAARRSPSQRSAPTTCSHASPGPVSCGR